MPELRDKISLQKMLDNMCERQLLVKLDNQDKGLVSYKEINSAVPVVAINNPVRPRVNKNKPNPSAKTCLKVDGEENDLVEKVSDVHQSKSSVSMINNFLVINLFCRQTSQKTEANINCFRE